LPTIAFAWVGCKLNRYEIQVISDSLRPYGFKPIPFAGRADCYVVNTCSVTSDADVSSRQIIRRARRRSPDSKIIVTGCYAQLRPEDIRALGVDAIVSNKDKDRLPHIVLNLFGIEDDKDFSASNEFQIQGMDGMTRAFVKIQDGCDDQCTFCTIWMARGPVNSRPADAIIHEINTLSQNGFKEVALTGVHIGKYEEHGIGFVRLLEKIIGETSIERLRLSSLNPREVTPELIALVTQNQRICPHLHLSIQSGDDDILRAMGRQYSAAEVSSIIKQAVQELPGITIGADFIVGFPGESESQFENTRTFIEQNEIHHLHIFPYSDRPDTHASELQPKVPQDIKSRRTSELRDLASKKKLEHLNKFIGKKLHVLYESRNYGASDFVTGLSENYLRVNSPATDFLKGNICEAVPHAVQGNILITDFIIGTPSDKKELTT
jgi:threonylcarbamoyladenosine tRNA methylthiotransferase MtaB